MFTTESTILKVPANEATHEFDAKNNAALLSKESVAELLENMLIILVRCDIVCTNEEVKQM